MSWKSVEMQVALPRTQDAGKLQDQMSKQNQRFQESLAQSQLKQEELKRTRVNKFDETVKSELRDKEGNSSNHGSRDGKENKKKTLKDQLEHPFLGNKIDFNG